MTGAIGLQHAEPRSPSCSGSYGDHPWRERPDPRTADARPLPLAGAKSEARPAIDPRRVDAALVEQLGHRAEARSCRQALERAILATGHPSLAGDRPRATTRRRTAGARRGSRCRHTATVGPRGRACRAARLADRGSRRARRRRCDRAPRSVGQTRRASRARVGRRPGAPRRSWRSVTLRRSRRAEHDASTIELHHVVPQVEQDALSCATSPWRAIAVLDTLAPPRRASPKLRFRRLPGAPEPPWPPELHRLARRVAAASGGRR